MKLKNIHTRDIELSSTASVMLLAENHLTTEGFVSNISEFIATKLKTVRLFTPNLLASFKSKDNTLKELRKERKKIPAITADKSFIAISEIEVGGMVGMNTDIFTIATGISNITRLVSENAYNKLDYIDTIISKLITEDDARKSFIDRKEEVKLLEEDNAMIRKAFDFVDSGSLKDTYKINEVIPNLASLELASEAAVKNLEVFDRKSIYKLRNIIEELEEKFELLYTTLENEHIVISNEALTLVVGLLNETAKYISNVSTLYYMNRQVGKTLLSVINKLS